MMVSTYIKRWVCNECVGGVFVTLSIIGNVLLSKFLPQKLFLNFQEFHEKKKGQIKSEL
jgi:hypothetical protein